MSDLLKGQVEVGDLVESYKTLRGEIEQRLKGVVGAGDAEQVERLRKEIRAHGEFVTKMHSAIDKRPRHEIGDTVEVVRFEYDDRGDYCLDFYEEGPISSVVGDTIVVHVPERVIPPRVIPAHIVKAKWSESREELVDDESYEYWPDYES